jgi:hypothetical protein
MLKFSNSKTTSNSWKILVQRQPTLDPRIFILPPVFTKESENSCPHHGRGYNVMPLIHFLKIWVVAP